MEADTKLEGDDTFIINVQQCHFATYAQMLELPEVGAIFCAADRYFFEQFQKDIKFERTQTLARDGKPCDFKFNWVE